MTKRSAVNISTITKLQPLSITTDVFQATVESCMDFKTVDSIKELFNLCDNSISTVFVFGSTLIR
ncbi:hypothetical protein MAR_002675 [Mya arenaria]|uniref:Uncharacterized protein n=1 Tax=Mya arenaria TaxID=6604 RepID=A0ABY7G3S9_MYAAR|nr:hypothetical protein MAR_002675 [Mya arenaria]